MSTVKLEQLLVIKSQEYYNLYACRHEDQLGGGVVGGDITVNLCLLLLLLFYLFEPCA